MTDDQFERTLRTVLDQQARRVDVAPDALTKIRARTRRKHRVHRGGFMLTLGTGTGVLAATVVFAFAGITGGCGSHPVATSPPLVTSSPSPRPSSSPQPVQLSIPAYYVGPGSRLYREYRSTTFGGGPLTPAMRVQLALVHALEMRALDPDYHSGWPTGTTVGVATIANGVATVDLDGATLNDGTAAANRAAIQQVVWTATAQTGVTGVKLLFDGAPRTTLWTTNQPVAGVLHRAPAVDTLAQMWVIDPQQGVVTGSPVTINVAGLVFEGAMGVEIRNAAGAVVQKPIHLTAGAPAQGSGSVTLALAPGTYIVVAYYKPLKGISTVYGDDHTFMVR